MSILRLYLNFYNKIDYLFYKYLIIDYYMTSYRASNFKFFLIVYLNVIYLNFFIKLHLIFNINRIENASLHYTLSICYWILNIKNKSLKQFIKVENIRNKFKKSKYYKNEIFLPRNSFKTLGLTGHVDGIIKYFFLSKKKFNLNIVLDQNDIINKYLFNNYKKYIKIYDINTVTKKILLKEKVYMKDFNWLVAHPYNSDKPAVGHSNYGAIFSEWNKLKKRSLIKIDSEANDLFKKFMKFYDIKTNSKYIILDIRTKKNHNTRSDEFRVGNINDYTKIINFITSLGFNIIILDIPENDDCINLKIENCKNKKKIILFKDFLFKNDRLFISLINNCELYIGNGSGAHVIANALKKNICLINIPLNEGWPYLGSYFLPKIYKFANNNKIIDLETILKKYSFIMNSRTFKNNNIKLCDNKPNIIYEAVKECMYANKIIKNSNYNESTKLNEYFKEINNKYETNIFGNISSAYLQNQQK